MKLICYPTEFMWRRFLLQMYVCRCTSYCIRQVYLSRNINIRCSFIYFLVIALRRAEREYIYYQIIVGGHLRCSTAVLFIRNVGVSIFTILYKKGHAPKVSIFFLSKSKEILAQYLQSAFNHAVHIFIHQRLGRYMYIHMYIHVKRYLSCRESLIGEKGPCPA